YSGGRVTFKYATPSECDPDAEGGAALFVLKGNRGTVTNFAMQYFPEGIHILGGAQNHSVGVDSDRICDDPFSAEGGTEAEISQADLTGGQCGCPSATGTECTGTPCNTNLCGRDKSIQINGGTGTVIKNSRFTKVGQPFLVNRVAPTSTTVEFRCNDV